MAAARTTAVEKQHRRGETICPPSGEVVLVDGVVDGSPEGIKVRAMGAPTLRLI